MRAIYLLVLYCAVFVTIAIGVSKCARFSRRLVSRNERDAPGQDVRVTETVTLQSNGDGAPIIKEEEVETNLSDNRKRRRREIPNNSECRSVKPPDNGQLTCTLGSPPNLEKIMVCKAVCIENYKFPDGSVLKPYNCTQTSNSWKKVIVPNCQPAKKGIGCEEIEDGKNQVTICITKSETKKCKSQCNPGYRFPDGKREMTIRCTKSTGVYDPVNTFPDCLLTDIKDDGSTLLSFDE